MVYSYISGRLVNQFFEYAYARTLIYKRGEVDDLCFNFNLVTNAGTEEDGFTDSLKYFRTLPYSVSESDIVARYGGIVQKLIYYAFKIHQKSNYKFNIEWWFRLLRKYGIIFQKYSDNNIKQIIPLTKNVFCYGKYENPEYFDEIRPIILKEFTPRIPPLERNKQLYSIIESTNSVCISIRRGDFLSDRFKDRFLVCDKEYFLKATEAAKKSISNPTFIFFSDDIDWVRKNIHCDVPCYYESGDDPVWEKLRLMYSCKHFIISNSTFSWWVQYLSRNEDKIVFAPERWSNIPNEKSNLLSDSFIKISTRT